MAELKPEKQYASLRQQVETAELGMWAFLATEVLFFGALIFSYYIYRISYTYQFHLTGHDSVILLGSINTVILLTSSLTMVAAIEYAKSDRERGAFYLLVATGMLGFCFIGIKGYEYVEDYWDAVVPVLNFVVKPGEQPPVELYWVFYFVATGIHAIHMSIGIVFVAIMAVRTRRGDFSSAYYSPLEVLGLYWSFVDTVWVFLWAAIYPLGRAS